VKKTIIGLLLAALTLFTTACGGEVPEMTTDTTAAISESTQEATTPKPEITWMTLPADRTLTAKQYFVYSCETGEFLTIAENRDTKIYPASVTKLFTAYVALQYLKPTQVLTAGDVHKRLETGSSIAEIWQGDYLPVENLIEGMLLPSGNDAAYILAEAAGKVMYGEQASLVTSEEAVSRFVQEMNAQAKLLGMTGTHFVNPHGIHDENHYTTYGDLAILATLVLEDPFIMKYTAVSKAEVTAPSGIKKWKNTNMIIDPESQYYCPYATGLKTGQTSAAGSCLLSSFEYGGQTLIIGVFGCPNLDDRFPDTLQLFNQAIGAP